MKNNATSHFAQAESNAKTLLHCKNTSLHNGEMEIKETMKAWLDAKNTNATEIARKCGNISQSTIHRILTGESPFPRAATVNQIAKALGIGYEQIYQMPPPDQDGYMRLDGHIDGLVVGEAMHPYNARLDPDVIDIQKLDILEHEESGVFLQKIPHDVVYTISTSISSLRNQATFSDPEFLAIITCYDDSMKGTFSSGDVLLVDKSVNALKTDAIYVMLYKDELFIRRIQRIPGGGVVMLSDNPAYQPLPVSAEDAEAFKVLGRIVLAWNARKL